VGLSLQAPPSYVRLRHRWASIGHGPVLTRCIEESGANTTSPPPSGPPSGARESIDVAISSAYQTLRDIAHRRLGRVGDRGGTLSTTGLVHETYLRLAEQSGAAWSDRAHFLAVASLAMRYVLVDRARARMTRKRGGAGDQVVTFDDEVMGADYEAEMVLDLNDALEQLAAWDPRLARVVDCRFFGGLTEPETAEALGITVRTVQRDWVKARILLRRALEA
jgi:RNA polymerase sigma factor (TIGR02999 family)